MPRRIIRPRFSLKAFLLVLSALCIWLGVTVHRARNQQEAVELVVSHEGHVVFDYERDAVNKPVFGKVDPPQTLLTRLAGIHYTQEVESVAFYGTNIVQIPAADVARALQGLPDLVTIGISNNVGVDDEVIRQISRKRNLQRLGLRSIPLAKIRLDSLRYCPLTELSLENTGLFDAHISFLRKLPALQRLDLARTRISEESLELLASLTNLRSLDIRNTKITKKGAKELRRQLPACTIESGWVYH